jgi:hypothetical protein
MVCFGVVHLVVAYLAVQIALGSGQQAADQRGALAEIGATSSARWRSGCLP